MLEFGEIPFGDLGDNVVKRRLEACGGGFSDSVGELGESVAKCDLGGSVGKGITGSFGCEGTGAWSALSVKLIFTHLDRLSRAFISMTR